MELHWAWIEGCSSGFQPSSPMLGTSGYCYTWRIRWDTRTNSVHIVPEELPHLMPQVLLNHTTASFRCQAIGLDGQSFCHTKNLHLEAMPDLGGVWRSPGRSLAESDAEEDDVMQ